MTDALTDTDLLTLEEQEAAAQTELDARIQAARVAECRGSFKAFCATYLPDTFNGFTQSQLDLVEPLEVAILHGGTFDREADRGIGTTTLITAAALWAGLLQHRRGILVVFEKQRFAMGATVALQMWIAHSPFILKDFENALFKISECVRCRGQYQNLTLPFRSEGQVIRPDLCLIDTVPDLHPEGENVQPLGTADQTLAAVRITSVER